MKCFIYLLIYSSLHFLKTFEIAFLVPRYGSFLVPSKRRLAPHQINQRKVLPAFNPHILNVKFAIVDQINARWKHQEEILKKC